MIEQPHTPTTVRIFGGVGVEHGGEPVSIGGPRQQRLLALLAIRAGSAVSIDWLAEHLWEDHERPEATAPALRTYFSRLRRALPAPADEWVQTVSAGYQLDAPRDAIEHLRVRDLRARARRARDVGDPSAARDALTEALDTWRGEPFRELENLDWARSEIEQLHLDRLEMFEERWEADLTLGRHTQITGELTAFTNEHKLRDRAAQQLALALHRSNRTAEALQVIAAFRERLAERSGLDPSNDMIELERALLSNDPSLAAPSSGQPLRGYRLLEETGIGAFSVVWRAEQPSVQRTVAIKQIRRELALQPDFIRRFEIEAHLVARLEHPHIVPLIDFWREPDSAYLVMRWLSGGTLEQRLDSGALGLAETLSIANQVGGALSAAHQKGVIHRDVRTANILFDDDGRAFLTDFGIALPAEATTGPEAALSPGSPSYASPEQIRRERLGPAADVFSLGVVLFECLTGTLPFAHATSPGELTRRQLDDDIPRLHELRADVPVHVSNAVADATAKRAEDRLPTIDAFLDALSAGRADTDSRVTAPQPSGRSATLTGADNPYLGLRAFDGADRAAFFGRARLVAAMTERLGGLGRPDRAIGAEHDLTAQALIAVGPSGSGKSSVVRAGLLPALRAGAVDGSADWYVTSMVPGDRPYEALEAALLRVAVNPPDSLLHQLRTGPRGILRSVRRCVDTDAGVQLLLVIDQFEEVFLGAAADDANDFLDALATAVEDPSSPLCLVATLRADHYHRPLEHPRFARVLTGSSIDVTPLAPDELEQAITGPATSVGATFEPGLVARIAADATGQPSPLPLLQYALRSLFDRRTDEGILTAAAYNELGGLTGSLAQRADELFDAGSDRERQAMRRIMGVLTDPTADSTDVRRRALRSALGQDEATNEVLASFTSARLLTLDRDPITREPTVEVAHEALLREWPRLVTWLAEDQQLLRTTDAIARAADAWNASGQLTTDLYRGDRLAAANDLAEAQPERLRALDRQFLTASSANERAAAEREANRVRRLRLLLAGTATALVVAMVAGAAAFSQFRRADDAAARATAEAQRAEQEAEGARLAADEADRQTGVAEDAARAAEFATLVSRSAAAGRDDPELGLLLALEARQRAADGDETASANSALLDRLGNSALATTVSSFEKLSTRSCDVAIVNSEGTGEFAAVDGDLVVRDALTGDITNVGPAPERCVEWLGDAELDRALVFTPDGSSVWAGTFNGPFDRQRTFDNTTFAIKRSFRPTGTTPMVSFTDDGPLVALMDVSTLDFIGEPVTGGENFFDAEVNESGSLVAASFATFEREGGDGETVVLDGVTGDEIVRVQTPLPVDNLFFDDATNQMIATTIDGRLLTIELATGEIVADVAIPGVGEVFDITIDDAGLVRLLASGQVVIIDPQQGPTGEVAELGNVNGGRFRDDGLVLGFGPDGSTDVIDVEASALVSADMEATQTGYVAIHQRLAVSASPGDRTPELIDLNSGDRTIIDLRLPDSSEHTPLVLHPETDALWTLGPENTVFQWIDGTVTGSLEVPGFSFHGNVRDQQWTLVSGERGGPDTQIHLIDLEAAGPSLRFAIPVAGAINAHPTNDRGVHVIDVEGVLTTFDDAGTERDRIDTGLGPADVLAADPSSERVAVARSFDAGAVIVDRADGSVQTLATFDTVVGLGFVRNGQYLVTVSLDGSVRLWDVKRAEPAGLVFEGTGARPGGGPWYDEASDSVWVSTSGSIIEVTLDPAQWVDRACAIVGRDLTDDEWARFVPGDEPVRSACGL